MRSVLVIVYGPDRLDDAPVASVASTGSRLAMEDERRDGEAGAAGGTRHDPFQPAHDPPMRVVPDPASLPSPPFTSERSAPRALLRGAGEATQQSPWRATVGAMRMRASFSLKSIGMTGASGMLPELVVQPGQEVASGRGRRTRCW